MLRAIIVVESRKPESLTDIWGIALSSYAMSTETTDQVLERRVRELLLLQETAKKVNSILDLGEIA